MKKEDVLKDIVWGNRLFINAQFSIGLVSILTKYVQSEVPIQKVFAYAHAIREQKNVKLYLDVKKGIGEILEIEKALHNNVCTIEDTKVIDFVIKNIIRSFTNTVLGEK